MKGKEIVSIKRKKKTSHARSKSKSRFIKNTIYQGKVHPRVWKHDDPFSALSPRLSLLSEAGCRTQKLFVSLKERGVHSQKKRSTREIRFSLPANDPTPSPLSSSTNGIKKRKQAAYIVLNTRIYDASPVLREQSRGDFLPSRKTGLRGAQEGVSRVSCTKVGKGGRGRRRKKRRTERGNIEKEKLTWW